MSAGETNVNGGRPQPPVKPRLHALAEGVERVRGLDAVAAPLGDAVRARLSAGAVRDALSGRWLGHALHPLMTDLPIGTWTSASLLDALGGDDDGRGAQRLIGLGVLSALPTAATGLLDWSDTERSDAGVRRVGVAHALSNVLALSLYGASYVARARGHHDRGRRLAYAGAGLLAVGGHLGGHLSYAKGVGVDATAFGPSLEDWTDAGPADELREDAPVLRRLEGVDVLLVRHGGRVLALEDRCSHRGGPLHDGAVEDGCITCPLHGSRFRLEDGSVESGPSPYPQPTFAVRERAGRVEVRSAHGGPTL